MPAALCCPVGLDQLCRRHIHRQSYSPFQKHTPTLAAYSTSSSWRTVVAVQPSFHLGTASRATCKNCVAVEIVITRTNGTVDRRRHSAEDLTSRSQPRYASVKIFFICFAALSPAVALNICKSIVHTCQTVTTVACITRPWFSLSAKSTCNRFAACCAARAPPWPSYTA